jgi:uncharacterized protein (DUF2249 family)
MGELDVRGLPKRDKHPAIFAAYQQLPVGADFVLVNNHDPKHLRAEFDTGYAGSYGWDYVERGPQVWSFGGAAKVDPLKVDTPLVAEMPPQGQ